MADQGRSLTGPRFVGDDVAQRELDEALNSGIEAQALRQAQEQVEGDVQKLNRLYCQRVVANNGPGSHKETLFATTDITYQLDDGATKSVPRAMLAYCTDNDKPNGPGRRWLVSDQTPINAHGDASVRLRPGELIYWKPGQPRLVRYSPAGLHLAAALEARHTG